MGLNIHAHIYTYTHEKHYCTRKNIMCIHKFRHTHIYTDTHEKKYHMYIQIHVI